MYLMLSINHLLLHKQRKSLVALAGSWSYILYNIVSFALDLCSSRLQNTSQQRSIAHTYTSLDACFIRPCRSWYYLVYATGPSQQSPLMCMHCPSIAKVNYSLRPCLIDRINDERIYVIKYDELSYWANNEAITNIKSSQIIQIRNWLFQGLDHLPLLQAKAENVVLARIVIQSHF